MNNLRDLSLDLSMKISIKQIRLFAGYSRPKRLKLEPSRFATAHLLSREQRVFVSDPDGSSRGFCQ